MKKFSLAISLFFLIQMNFQSQEEIYSHYNDALVFTNPACAGINNNFSFKGLSRHQWVDIPSQFTSNGFALESFEDFLKMGFALSYKENTEGESILKTRDFKFGWNYRVGDAVGSRYSLIFGLQYSNSFKSIDWNNLTFIGDFDPILGNINQGLFTYPALNQINYSNISSGFLINFDMSPRTRKQSSAIFSKFSLGGSLNNLIKNERVFINENINHSGLLGFPRKLSLHGLLEWKNENSKQESTIISHGFFYQKSSFLSTGQLNLLDVNIYPFKIGFSLRSQLSNINNVKRESAILNFGYQFISTKSNFSFSILYSRDFTISELAANVNGTNEFLMIFENLVGGVISKFHKKSEKKRQEKSIPCNKFNTKSQISTRMGYM